MLKFLFLGLVLWQGIYEIAGGNGSGSTDTNSESISSMADQKTVDSKDIISKTGGYYDFHAGSIIFSLNGLLPRKNQVSGSINGVVDARNTLDADYLVTGEIGAHKLHLRKLPWNKARKICIEEGGHLAVIRSISEEKIVLQMMREGSTEEAWLGVHDKFEEGDWITVMDEPLGQAGWAKWSKAIAINPDNFQGKQHCARMITNGGGMDDENCDVSKPFICKRSNI